MDVQKASSFEDGLQVASPPVARVGLLALLMLAVALVSGRRGPSRAGLPLPLGRLVSSGKLEQPVFG